MKIQTILDHIDANTLALPEFQRGYVWNREQVRGLMASLYRKHPVGGLLVWETRVEQANVRGDGKPAVGTVKLLLDGQQRVTTLYGIIRGRPPQFFEGNDSAFTGLYFNVEEEVFEFWSPIRMKDNPLWISVTDLLGKGLGEYIGQFAGDPNMQVYFNRLNEVTLIRDINLHIEEISGQDKTVEIVVDIFNKVNSGGTKLSKGDLALAKICAEWPDARDEMNERLVKWERAGFEFKLDWFLRCVNAIVTGEALFIALSNVPATDVERGIQQAEDAVDMLLNIISSRLGLDYGQVLGSVYAFPLMAHYLVRRGGRLDYRERDKLLYWYIHTMLWGRYSGSTETVLNQDLALVEDLDGGLDRLIEQLRRNRGDLRVHANDFIGWSRGARFYPMMYLLTRVSHARDWGTGVELRGELLGKLSGLQVHHIFPKALLYEYGYDKKAVNQLANFAFLTQETNLAISDRAPAEYLEEVERNHPGVLETHWIPMDRDLWQIDRFSEFLAARRELLARAANNLLDNLLHGEIPETSIDAAALRSPREAIPGQIASSEEEQRLFFIADWVEKQGLPAGELLYEVTDPETGEVLAVFDLAWPEGLQQGLSQPVAILIDEPRETETIANNAGFRFFLDVESFQDYVRREILAIEAEVMAAD